MSIYDNKLIIRQYIDEVVNTGNVENIGQYISPDYTEIYQGRRYSLGLKGAKEHILGVRQTYPDLTITIEYQIAEGELIATSYVATGTHRGVWLGMKPSGKLLTFYGVNVDRIVNGLIVEHGGAANMLEPLLDAGSILVIGK